MIRLIYANQVDMTEQSGQGVHEREISSFLVDDPEIDGHYVGQKPAEPCPLDGNPKAHLIPLPIKNTKGFLLYQWRLFRILRRLTRGRTGRDTVIFLRYAAAMVAPLLVARRRNIPLVIRTGPTMSNLDYYGKKTNWLSYRLIKHFTSKHFKKAARIITVSSQIRDAVRKDFGLEENKFVISHNGCNEKTFDVMDTPRLPDDLQHLAGRRLVCFVGRQDKHLGVEDVIEAIAILSRLPEYDDLSAIIIGDGPIHAALKQQAEASGLAERVLFTGPQDQNYISKVLNSSLAAFLPWRKIICMEKGGGCPMKLFEYIATGVPVIATRYKDTLFLEDNDLGMLVEPDSPPEMAEAIRQMVDNPRTDRDERLRRRQYALDHGTWNAAYKRLRNICESALLK